MIHREGLVSKQFVITGLSSLHASDLSRVPMWGPAGLVTEGLTLRTVLRSNCADITLAK